MDRHAVVRWNWQPCVARIVAVVVIAGLGARPAAAACVGDCHGDGAVDIADLVVGVAVAAGVWLAEAVTLGSARPDSRRGRCSRPG